MAVISVSVPDGLLSEVDKAVQELGYKSRSELIREALEYLLRAWRGEEGGDYRLVVVVSRHREHPRVDQKIMEVVYRSAGFLRGLYHQVLDGDKCVTVIIMEEGPAAGAVTAKLRSLRGVERVLVSRL